MENLYLVLEQPALRLGAIHFLNFWLNAGNQENLVFIVHEVISTINLLTLLGRFQGLLQLSFLYFVIGFDLYGPLVPEASKSQILMYYLNNYSNVSYLSCFHDSQLEIFTHSFIRNITIFL